MKKIPVILDGDPGADDALGMLLALSAPGLDVLGITAVFGNGPVELMTRNGARVCGLAKRSDIAVYPGARHPLKRNISFDPRYCGEDGMCGCGLAEFPQAISHISALTFLKETLEQAQEPVTVVATAGFTNLAELLLAYPEVVGKIEKIVTASGYFGFNRDSARGEWNICVDPEAAGLVYESGIPIVAVGLDVTARLRDDWADRLIREKKGPVRDFMAACVEYDRRAGLAPASILVDAMAAAVLIRPELASLRRGSVRVFPEREGAEQMEFRPVPQGSVRAAFDFQFGEYLTMIGGLME